MPRRYTDREVGPLPRRGIFAAVASIALLAGGCDSDTADLVRDIDAAREGCTEEMLKAADEECVRMFGRYADMAAGAMESYIGGMRAFDEAIRRRGGVLFDTAGLGSALSDGWRSVNPGSIDPAAVRVRVPSRDPWQGEYDPNADPYYSADPYGPVTGGRWSDPVPGGAPAYEDPYLQPDQGAGRTPAAGGRASTVRRGVLLPPEERLQRPWIDGADADDRYVEDPRLRDATGGAGAQGGDGYPYPGGPQGGYPYGAPGQYPAGPPPGSPAYPYGGTGSAYPYPQPPGTYPYPDGRSGSW